MLNEEGGIDPEQFRIEAIIERMDVLGKAFLGLTINCCQCHDHKYDPISQREYYRLFAFLNNDDEPTDGSAGHRRPKRRGKDIRAENRGDGRSIDDPISRSSGKKWRPGKKR